MTAHYEHRPNPHRVLRRLSTGLETVDTQWKAYHRFVFRICTEHLSPSNDLALLALTVADEKEITGLISRLLTRADELSLGPDAVADLTSVAATTPAEPSTAAGTTQPAASLRRLQQVCFRVVQRNETLHPVVVDYITDTAEIPATSPPFPDIVSEIATLFGLTPEHTRILIALFAVEDIEVVGNMMHQATYRRQMRILSDVAEVDLAAFVRETVPGSPLERLGLLAYRGGRDEIADMSLSRPLLFALRSNTLDDLRAGLFDDTPLPQFQLDEFTLPPDEMRTCAAAIRGGHPLLIAGEPGIGKTEFVRTLVTALGRRAHTLAATNRRSESLRGPRFPDADGSRFNAIRMAVNLLSPTDDVLIIDEADALLENLPVPTVWITNDYRMIPASALRRFGHVYAFPHPSVDTRVRMLTERLAPFLGHQAQADATRPESDTWTRDLAVRYDITPAAIDRTARIIAAELDAQELAPADVRARVAAYIDQIASGALAHDVRRLPTVS